MSMVNMGLDVSTSVCAFSVIKHDANGSHLLDYGYIKSSKKNIIDKAIETINALIPYIQKHNPDNITLEQMLKSFKWGKTSTDVLIKLAQYNGLIQMLLYIKSKKRVWLVHPVTARRLAWGDTFHGVKDKKLSVLERVSELFPIIVMTIAKRQRGKQKGAPVKEVFDVADSVTMAMITDFSELDQC